MLRSGSVGVLVAVRGHCRGTEFGGNVRVSRGNEPPKPGRASNLRAFINRHRSGVERTNVPRFGCILDMKSHETNAPVPPGGNQVKCQASGAMEYGALESYHREMVHAP